MRITYAIMAFLLFAGLYGCKPSTPANTPATPAADSTTAAPMAPVPVSENTTPAPTGELRVAWVYMDSLLNGYDYYFALQREMREITAKAEQEIQSKGKVLESRAAKFQDQAQKGLMTRSEMQTEQEALAGEQTRMLQLQEKHRQNLMEEEQVRTRKVMAAIQAFLTTYASANNYHYILHTGGVLYGHPGLNVTSDVLKGLNAAYATEKAKNNSK